MSALGQKRTFAVQTAMSALPPIADILSRHADVYFVPIADMSRRAFDPCINLTTQHPKMIGFVKSASAPPSKALRLVSASP